MLTIYEQIQQVVDLVEANLVQGVTARQASRAAGMSVRSLHRYFPALTGFTLAEYVRRRRLSEAMEAVTESDVSIVEIAIAVGYDSHEAFTRAFKKEYGIPPLEFRVRGEKVARIARLDLVGVVHMGVLTRWLPRMTVVVFDGFKPDPEYTAQRAMEAWMARHSDLLGTHRIFGHNIDAEGDLAHDPDNVGYRLQVSLSDSALAAEDDARRGVIEAGEFVVTGIEGSLEDDPSGAWITAGWRRLQEMMERNGLEMHSSCRWFEEWLEPTRPGLTRMDLYVEVTPESAERLRAKTGEATATAARS